MELVDLSEETQDFFFRCLQDEREEDPRLTTMRRQWYEKYKNQGFKAKLLKLADGKIVGLCQYIPIEHSHLIGEDLITLLCIFIHGYEHGVGNHQKKGYGRFMLKAVEQDAKAMGAKGIAAWGIDWETNWMQASFFEHMGYLRADEEDKVVVFWKPFGPDVNPPKLMRLPTLPKKETGKVSVRVAANSWCLGCYKILCAREAVKGLKKIVDYSEKSFPEHENILHLGMVGGIFLDGKVFHPYKICDIDSIRAEILRLYEEKNRKK